MGMLSRKASENLTEAFDNGAKVAIDTLREILHYLNFYNRNQFWVGRVAENEFAIFDGKISGDCAQFTKKNVLKTLNKKL